MVVYDLACDGEHRFEGWFGSVEEFERQNEAHTVTCPTCGSSSISRLPSGSYVNTGAQPPVPAPSGGAPGMPGEAVRQLVAAIEYLVRNTEDVGRAFPEQARRIHYKEAPARAIRGVASPDEVDELREEGIDVVAVPVPVPPGPEKIH